MAESPDMEATKDCEPTEPEAPAPVVSDAPVQYLLKNVTRGRSNRTARVAVPGRIPFVQRLAGGRIIVRRARSARISEAVLKENLAEIAKHVALQTIVVTTLDGKVVDVETFNVVKQAAPASPLPNPPLDSAKNDKNEGIGYNVPGSPEGTTMDSEEPELLRQNSLLEVEEPTPEAPPADLPVFGEVPFKPEAEAPPAAEAEAEDEEGDDSEDEEGDEETGEEPALDATATPSTSPAPSGKKKKRRKGKRGNS
jgi:hypothetical protein